MASLSQSLTGTLRGYMVSRAQCVDSFGRIEECRITVVDIAPRVLYLEPKCRRLCLVKLTALLANPQILALYHGQILIQRQLE